MGTKTPVVMRDFPGKVVQLGQRKRGAGQCVNTPGAARKGLVSMRPHDTPPTTNRAPIDNGDGTFSIPLNKGLFALIDACDLSLVSQYRWRAVCTGEGRRTPYAMTGNGGMRRGKKREHHMMHRLILGLRTGDALVADHVNCDGLDNRRCNLRAVTVAENTRRIAIPRPNKSSRFRGVSWSKEMCRWFVAIKVNQKSQALGYFENEEDAARAYDRAAAEHFGPFAVLNFSEEGEAA